LSGSTGFNYFAKVNNNSEEDNDYIGENETVDRIQDKIWWYTRERVRRRQTWNKNSQLRNMQEHINNLVKNADPPYAAWTATIDKDILRTCEKLNNELERKKKQNKHQSDAAAVTSYKLNNTVMNELFPPPRQPPPPRGRGDRRVVNRADENTNAESRLKLLYELYVCARVQINRDTYKIIDYLPGDLTNTNIGDLTITVT